MIFPWLAFGNSLETSETELYSLLNFPSKVYLYTFVVFINNLDDFSFNNLFIFSSALRKERKTSKGFIFEYIS